MNAEKIKLTVTIIPLDSGQRKRLGYIIQAVDRAVSRIDGHTDADISAGIKIACDAFFRGESAATAIEMGYQYAKQLISQRRTEIR